MPSLTKSISSFTLKSSWTYKKSGWDADDEEYWYSPTTASTGTKTVSVDLSSIPAGSRVTAATFKIRTSNGASTAKANGKSFSVTNDHTSGINVLSWFSSLGSSLSIVFSFQYSSVPASSRTSSSGSRSSYFDAMQLIITYELPASSGSFDVSTVEAGAGSSVDITITPTNAAYTHTVTWTFGSVTETDQLAAGETFASFNLPLSILNQIPNATSGTGTAVVSTYNGETLMGTNTYEFTVTVPASVVPTAGNLSATPQTIGVHQDLASTFIQGYSTANMSLPSVAGAYGSTITSVVFSGWGGSVAGTGNNGTYTGQSDVLISSGTVTLTALITDSRGRTATKTLDITVASYGRPVISAVTAKRCDDDNAMTINDQGTCARIVVTYSISSVNNLNAATTETYYKLSSDVAYTNANATFTNNTPYKIGNNNLSPDGTYNIKVVVTDKAGNSSTAVVTVPTATYVLHFRNGGTSVGVGQAALAQSNAFSINANWDAYAGGANIAKFPKHMAIVADIAASPYNNDANNCTVAGTYTIASVSSTVSNIPIQKTGQLIVGSSLLDERAATMAATATCSMYQMYMSSDISDIYTRTMATTGTAGLITFGTWRKLAYTSDITASNFTGTLPIDNGGTGQTTAAGVRTGLGLLDPIVPGDVVSIATLNIPAWVTSSKGSIRSTIYLGRRITATACSIAGTGNYLISGSGKIYDGVNITTFGTFSYNIRGDVGAVTLYFAKSTNTSNNTVHLIQFGSDATLTFS